MCAHYRHDAEREAIRAAADLAAEPHGGVFAPADLRSQGISPDVIRSMVAKGLWRRLRYGVYVDVARWDATASDVRARHLLECAAAIRALAERAFLFGRSGAVAHGLPLPVMGPPSITLVRDSRADHRVLQGRRNPRLRLPDIRLVSHDLSTTPTSVVGGLPSVSIALAAVSAAATASEEWAVAIMDAASWQRPDVPQLLEATAADWPYLRGIGTVRRALPMVRTGAQSPLESISRFRLMAAGLPEPRLQVPLEDDKGLIGFADMLWEELGVIGEADGLMKYTDTSALTNEKLREDRLRALGYIVVRWTWLEMMTDPERVVRRILDAAAISLRRTG